MEAGVIQGLLFPVIVLLIEYLIIQPWLRYRETRLSVLVDTNSGSGGRKWRDGIKTAIKQFKGHFDNYNWGGFSIKQHFVEILDFSISRGQAEITLIVNVRYILDKKRMVGEFRITTDRVGDISKLETISVQKNPFAHQDIQFPRSWLIIGILALVFMMFRSIPFPQPLPPLVTDGYYYGTPVSQFWAQTIPVKIASTANGTLGESEIDVYNFKTDLSGRVTIEIVPVDRFECFLSIYDQHNSLIRRVLISRGAGKIEIAPEQNVSYLIIVDPYTSGGSYILSILSSSP